MQLKFVLGEFRGEKIISPMGLDSCIAVHTMPFLRVEDGMVLSKPQLPNVLALIHC